MEGDTIILQMKGIDKYFPGVHALDNVDFELKKGEVHVLIGENGAGKSTLMKILSGAYSLAKGDILIDGKKVVFEHPHDALENGISVIYQETNLNPYTTVYENVFLGREYKAGPFFIDRLKAIKETEVLINKIGIEFSPKALVKDLGMAQQQLVEIIKALSIKSRIIVFDEPTSTLSDKETQKLFSLIRELKEQGCGIVYISHRLEELFEIGDRCTVLRNGKYVGTKNISDIAIEELISMMVGREVSETTRFESYSRSDNALSVSNLNFAPLLRNISFTLKKGEILGFAGLVGAGRTELAKCIIGDCRFDSGIIHVENEEVRFRSVHESLKAGVAYCSEDRKGEGLFLDHSVVTNITIATLTDIMKKGFIRYRNESKIGNEQIGKLSIKTSSIKTKVKNLSGGNQQKVIISRWLLTNAKIIIFDEPTRGIDVLAKDEIHKIMIELLKRGIAIIMISSELPEILKMSDRIVVMRQGEIKAIMNNKNIIQEDILHYAFGANKVDM